MDKQTNTSSNAISTPAVVTFIPASYPLVKDREAWRAAIHGVVKESDMTERLNNNKTLGLAAWKAQLYLQKLVNATKQLWQRPGQGKDQKNVSKIICNLFPFSLIHSFNSFHPTKNV